MFGFLWQWACALEPTCLEQVQLCFHKWLQLEEDVATESDLLGAQAHSGVWLWHQFHGRHVVLGLDLFENKQGCLCNSMCSKKASFRPRLDVSEKPRWLWPLFHQADRCASFGRGGRRTKHVAVGLRKIWPWWTSGRHQPNTLRGASSILDRSLSLCMVNRSALSELNTCKPDSRRANAQQLSAPPAV